MDSNDFSLFDILYFTFYTLFNSILFFALDSLFNNILSFRLGTFFIRSDLILRECFHCFDIEVGLASFRTENA